MWPFSRKIPLATQLRELARIGIRMNPEASEADLLEFGAKERFEAKPYQGLIEALANSLEREPYSPIADRLWMCDFECIEDHGDYTSVLLRLERMTGHALGMTDVEDFVDLDEEVAWIQFKLDGELIRWTFEVKDDWLDPKILLEYDELLAELDTGIRLYSNHADYGQAALLGAFSEEEKEKFDELTSIRMHLTAAQR